ncbi:oligosaccharide flippase family protein [Bacillus songklensis]|uniref:Oligosaccharide flippase family protein n=1 Tax=Bacillus songklensis TaxID=1069116 RepID=A0ABV8B2I0_9BACI
MGSAGLMVGQILGQLPACLLLFRDIWKKEKNLIKKSVHFGSIKRLLIRYKKFPLFSTWSSLMNTSSVHLPVLLLAVFFSPAAVGQYTLANRVLMAPVSIIGSAISQAFLQKAIEENRKERLGEFSLLVFRKLLAFGFIPLILLSIAAPELFNVAFGPEWEKAGLYVQFLSVWVLFVFISSPLSSIFNILELQKENLFFNSLLFLSRLIVLLIGGFLGNDVLTIALFGITGAILWFYHVIWLLKLAGVHFKVTITSLLTEAGVGLPFFLAAAALKFLIKSDVLLIVLLMAVLMVFVLYRFKEFVINTGKRKGVTM